MPNTIVITGASRGLGYALLEEYINLGNIVLPIVRGKESFNEILEKFKKNYFPILSDIIDDNCKDVIKNEINKFGINKVDVLINNAGIGGVARKLEDISPLKLRELFETHCVGVVKVTQALIPFLLKSNNPKIINLSSRMGSLKNWSERRLPSDLSSYEYRISKAAQNMFTVSLAYELKDKNVFVAAIHPGKLKTPLGLKGADLEPIEAAKRIIDFISTSKIEDTGIFYEPGVWKLDY